MKPARLLVLFVLCVASHLLFAACLTRDGQQYQVADSDAANASYIAKGYVPCPSQLSSNVVIDQLTNSAYIASWDIVNVMATYSLTNADILLNTDELQTQAKEVTNLTIQTGMIMDGARAGIEYLALGGILTTNRFLTNSVTYTTP